MYLLYIFLKKYSIYIKIYILYNILLASNYKFNFFAYQGSGGC